VDAARSLVHEMMDLAHGTTPGVMPAASFAAFEWIVAFGGKEAEARVRQALWARPDLIVTIVKTLRRLARDPKVPRTVRRDAQATLARHGFDDTGLASEG
jgi:hypothetical protein